MDRLRGIKRYSARMGRDGSSRRKEGQDWVMCCCRARGETCTEAGWVAEEGWAAEAMGEVNGVGGWHRRVG